MTILGATSPPQFAIGESDYRDLRRKGMTYVDKTRWAADILGQGAKVHIVPRPRRFGKTLNMSMLRYFVERTGEDRTDLFADTVLWTAEGGRYRQHFQRYPTIYLSFKDLREATWEGCLAQLSALLAATAQEVSSSALGAQPSDDEALRAQLPGASSPPLRDAQFALLALTRWLHQTTGEQCIVLIDDYDTPLHAALQHGYWDEAVRFFGGFLSAGLKDTTHVYKAVLAGSYLVNLTDSIGGFNNFTAHTFLNTAMSAHFGFDEHEVISLCEAAKAPELAGVLSEYCGGYRCGNAPVRVLCNPGTVVARLQAAFLTSAALRQEFNDADSVHPAPVEPPSWMAAALSSLLDGEPFKLTNDGFVDLPQVSHSGAAAFGLLFHSGLLTALAIESTHMGPQVTLGLPNLCARAALEIMAKGAPQKLSPP